MLMTDRPRIRSKQTYTVIFPIFCHCRSMEVSRYSTSWFRRWREHTTVRLYDNSLKSKKRRFLKGTIGSESGTRILPSFQRSFPNKRFLLRTRKRRCVNHCLGSFISMGKQVPSFFPFLTGFCFGARGRPGPLSPEDWKVWANTNEA